MRTNKLEREHKLGASIPLEHRIVGWLSEYVAWMHNILKVGKDGITPYHRARGRPYTKRLICFGESVLAQAPTKGPEAQNRGKLEARWYEGVMLGYGMANYAYIG